MGVAYSVITLSLSACECCEQVSCDNALLALDVDKFVEPDNDEMFDDVDLDDTVDVELCDGEKDCHYFVLSSSIFYSFHMQLFLFRLA